MKVAILTDGEYGHSGIEKVEEQLVGVLDEQDIDTVLIDHRWTRRDFPLSRTVDSFLAPRKVEQRLQNEVFDKIFVPAQSRMLFDPDKFDAEVLVYVHDVFPATHFFKYEQERSWLYENLLSLIGHRVKDRWMQNLMKADKILTPTEYVKNDLETRTPFDQEIKVLGQGIDNLPEVEKVVGLD